MTKGGFSRMLGSNSISNTIKLYSSMCAMVRLRVYACARVCVCVYINVPCVTVQLSICSILCNYANDFNELEMNLFGANNSTGRSIAICGCLGEPMRHDLFLFTVF